MNLENFDAIFVTVMPFFFVITALILFPMSIIVKVIFVLAQKTAKVTAKPGNKHTGSPEYPIVPQPMPPAGDPPPFDLLDQF